LFPTSISRARQRWGSVEGEAPSDVSVPDPSKGLRREDTDVALVATKSNENTNDLLRQYFPKSHPLNKIENDLALLTERLNNRRVVRLSRENADSIGRPAKPSRVIIRLTVRIRMRSRERPVGAAFCRPLGRTGDKIGITGGRMPPLRFASRFQRDLALTFFYPCLAK
jgi:hypothetical protein